MARTVTAAIVQVAWTGDKESMIELHEKYVAEAAAAGTGIMCFQELFYGPYFCQVQDTEFYSYAEAIPGRADHEALPRTRRKIRASSWSCPMYEEEQAGVLYNTAAVIDADGSYLGKYRKIHIPQVKGFWEKFYFRPGNLGYPVFDTAVGKVGVSTSATTGTSQKVGGRWDWQWRRDRLQSVSHQPRLVGLSLAARTDIRRPRPTCISSAPSIASVNRITYGDNDFYGTSYFANPRGQFVGDTASDTDGGAGRARSRSRVDPRGSRPVGVLSRSAADLYGPLTTP